MLRTTDTVHHSPFVEPPPAMWYGDFTPGSRRCGYCNALAPRDCWSPRPNARKYAVRLHDPVLPPAVVLTHTEAT